MLLLPLYPWSSQLHGGARSDIPGSALASGRPFKRVKLSRMHAWQCKGSIGTLVYYADRFDGAPHKTTD